MTSSVYVLIVIFIVNLLATTGDVTLSWTSPIYPKLYSNDSNINPFGTPITPDQDAWIGSLLNVGAILGTIPFGLISSRYGRKVGLLAVAIPHIISFITMALAKNVYLFYIARFVGGLSVGGGYVLLPLYIAEISQDHNRGAMSLTLNIFWALGNFIPYAIGPFMSIYSFNIVLSALPIVFLVLFVFLGTESPYFLVRTDRIGEATETLMFLRSSSKAEVQEEIDHIKTYIEQSENGNILDFFRHKYLRTAFMICTITVMLQELGGFCAITYHLQIIFIAAGSEWKPELSALVVGLVHFVSSFISPFLVDRVGRRLLIIWSCLGMFVALILLGGFFYIQDIADGSTTSIFWVPIFSLIFYIIFFNLGICSVPWTLTSEMFPNNLKEVAASTITSIAWITSFITTNTYNDMNDFIGRPGTFWFFAASCFCGAIFSVVYVPETKGKSFSEIQQMLLTNEKSDGVKDNDMKLEDTNKKKELSEKYGYTCD
ncbi:unnamed protein product [Phaedon cochleariae]|uniref:Major facilitator superfamily (MFS) profile domain-containing protein n=1 Tax=Phaedon cochleariae TaxID=80249 RepID=A0A9P0DRR8_PHACE|nr:unnamed protein product [Phaedon cochleariae]